MSTCGQISSSKLLNCDYPNIKGVNDRLILINKDDWDNATITRDAGNNQLITAISLASGADAYKYEGKNESVEPRNALVKGRYTNTYEHEIRFIAWRLDAASKAELEQMVQGKLVAIVQNNHRDASAKACFEVYGEDSGLAVEELESNKMDDDTQGAYNILLKTPENVRESHLPATIWDTDFAITKAIVDSLL